MFDESLIEMLGRSFFCLKSLRAVLVPIEIPLDVIDLPTKPRDRVGAGIDRSLEILLDVRAGDSVADPLGTLRVEVGNLDVRETAPFHGVHGHARRQDRGRLLRGDRLVWSTRQAKELVVRPQRDRLRRRLEHGARGDDVVLGQVVLLRINEKHAHVEPRLAGALA